MISSFRWNFFKLTNFLLILSKIAPFNYPGTLRVKEPGSGPGWVQVLAILKKPGPGRVPSYQVTPGTRVIHYPLQHYSSQFHGLCLSESALKSQNHKWMLAFCVKPHIIMNHIPLLATFVKSLLDCLTYLLYKVANFELFCWNFLSITNSEKGEVTMYNSIKVYFIISISISPFIVQYT